MRKDELGNADMRVRGGLVEQLARVAVAANMRRLSLRVVFSMRDSVRANG